MTAQDKLIANTYSIISFLRTFSSDTAQDVDFTWINDDDSTTDITFQNIKKYQDTLATDLTNYKDAMNTDFTDFKDAINLLVGTDDESLDSLQEVIDMLKSNKSIIDNLKPKDIGAVRITDNILYDSDDEEIHTSDLEAYATLYSDNSHEGTGLVPFDTWKKSISTGKSMVKNVGYKSNGFEIQKSGMYLIMAWSMTGNNDTNNFAHKLLVNGDDGGNTAGETVSLYTSAGGGHTNYGMSILQPLEVGDVLQMEGDRDASYWYGNRYNGFSIVRLGA